MRARRTSRKTEGYALVSIIVIGLFAIMLLLALGSMLVSIAQSEAVSKHKAGLLNAAETGLEYVLYDIKRANSANEPTYDFGDDSPPVTVNVPTSWLDDDQMTVKARVWKVGNEDLQKVEAFSLLWSPQLDPSQGDTSSFSEPVRSKLGLAESEFFHTKVVEVTASRGVFSKSIRAIALPESSTLNPASSFPSVGILAISDLSVSSDGGSLSISDPSNSFTGDGPYRYALSIQSNKQISLTGSSGTLDVKANVIASNNSAGAPSDFVSSDGNATIHGRLETNGGYSAAENFVAQNGSQPNLSADNVLADADKVQSANPDIDRGGENTVPIATDAGGTPIGVDSVPSTSLQDLSINGSNTNSDLSNFLNALSNGNFGDPGTTITFENGIDSSGNVSSSYSVDSLVLNDTVAKVQIPSDIGQPVKIYVQGNNSESAVDIDASRLKNFGSPENLQIYYSGSKDVNISLNSGQFSGLIYAPNAKVSVRNGSSNSEDQSFNGAIVGNEVNIAMRGNMNLVPDPSSGSGSSAPARTSTRYNLASYQEVNGKLVE